MRSRIARSTAALVVFFLLIRGQAWAQRQNGAATPQLNFIAFGDWGSGTPDQKSVAEAMAAAAAKQQPTFNAAITLGDNFYVELPGGAKSNVWKTMFEEMYSKEKMPFPFYVTVGNHDIETDAKLQAELDYARENPTSRWKLPARWYRLDLPEGKPLVSFLILDSNHKEMPPKLFEQETNWLEKELAKPRPGKWLVCIAHHPLFNNGKHKDDKYLINNWGPLFKKYDVELYLTGHDHNLQHLEIPDWPTSFCISGGGGQSTYGMQRTDRGPFASAGFGFATLCFTPETLSLRFFDKAGKQLHAFDRKPNVVATPDSTAAAVEFHAESEAQSTAKTSAKKTEELKWAKEVATDFVNSVQHQNLASADMLVAEEFQKTARAKTFRDGSAAEALYGLVTVGAAGWSIENETISPDTDEAVFRGTFKHAGGDWVLSVRVAKQRDGGKWRVIFYDIAPVKAR
ncbi:MAG TPA: metallophosphoesterase [Pirellulales bacterium]|nr:metallophosphoesterase [Pirellulales bacterium]